MILALTLFSLRGCDAVLVGNFKSRPVEIVVETEQVSDRGNFPSKSKAKNFDSLHVGLCPSGEIFAVTIQRVTMAQNNRGGVRGLG